MRIVMTTQRATAIPDRESKEKVQERKTAPVLENEQKSRTNTTHKSENSTQKSERDWERQTFLLWPGD